MPGPQSAFIPPYRELYLNDFSELGEALVGYGLRREFEREVRTRPELLMKGITRVWTRWGTAWVVQCGGDSRNNRVRLAGRERGTTFEVTLPFLQRYEWRTPLKDTEQFIARLKEDYYPTTPTGAVVRALESVLIATAFHRAHRNSGVPLAQIDRAVAEALRPYLADSLYGDEITEANDQEWRLK